MLQSQPIPAQPQLLFLILSSAFLQGGALLGGLILVLKIQKTRRISDMTPEAVQSVAILLIAIAVCVIGAVQVMPA